MATKTHGPGEVVSIYDPARGSYREVPLAELGLYLESLGVPADQAQAMVKDRALKHLEALGFTAEEAAARLEKLLKKEA